MAPKRHNRDNMDTPHRAFGMPDGLNIRYQRRTGNPMYLRQLRAVAEQYTDLCHKARVAAASENPLALIEITTIPLGGPPIV